MQEFDAIAIQLMPQPDSIRPYAIVKVVLFSAAKAIEEERDRLLDKDYGARLALLLNHGHDAPYTDDGELQCAECRPNWDYRRLPIKTLIFQLVGLHKEEVDRLKAELAEARTALQWIADSTIPIAGGYTEKLVGIAKAALAGKEEDDEKD